MFTPKSIILYKLFLLQKPKLQPLEKNCCNKRKKIYKINLGCDYL